jgi:hypothetical protein
VVHVLRRRHLPVPELTEIGEEATTFTLDVPRFSAAKPDVVTPSAGASGLAPAAGRRSTPRRDHLDAEASSVVGLENPSHLFVRIHRELPPGMRGSAVVPELQAGSPRRSPGHGRKAARRRPTSRGEYRRRLRRPWVADESGEQATPVASVSAPERGGDELFFSLSPWQNKRFSPSPPRSRSRTGSHRFVWAGSQLPRSTRADRGTAQPAAPFHRPRIACEARDGDPSRP